MSFQYLIDANIFIQAKNFHYRFDTFPGYWEWLDRKNELGLIGSIKFVYDELVAGKDDLAAWIKERNSPQWFVSEDDDTTQLKLGEIAAWITSQQFTAPAQEEFLRGADPWLVAKAAVTGATIVTHEKLSPGAKKKIYIPNVCQAFGVQYIDDYELIRRTGARFGLQ